MNRRGTLLETVTLEQSKEIMSFSIGVEEAVLKLYKYVSENVNDNNILSHVVSLKTSISKFNLGLQGQMKDNEEEQITSQSEKEFIDNPRKVEKGVLEAIEPEKTEPIQVHEPEEEPEDMEQEIKESVKKEKFKIDISKEWSLLESKANKETVKRLVSRLENNSKKVGEILGEAAQNQYESKIEDFKFQVKNIKTLNEAMNNLYDWADDNNVLIEVK